MQLEQGRGGWLVAGRVYGGGCVLGAIRRVGFLRMSACGLRGPTGAWNLSVASPNGSVSGPANWRGPPIRSAVCVCGAFEESGWEAAIRRRPPCRPARKSMSLTARPSESLACGSSLCCQIVITCIADAAPREARCATNRGDCGTSARSEPLAHKACSGWCQAVRFRQCAPGQGQAGLRCLTTQGILVKKVVYIS